MEARHRQRTEEDGGLPRRQAPAGHLHIPGRPKTTDKEDLIDMEEPGLIDGLDGFPEAAMAAFMRAVEPSGATS